MVTFPSKEWAEEFIIKVNDSEEYENAASDWEGTFTIFIQEEDGKLDEDFILWLDPWHGKVRGFEILQDIEDKESTFILRGKYTTWKSVMKGEKNATKLMMAGKLRLKGKMLYALRRPKASAALMTVFQSVNMEFIDEI